MWATLCLAKAVFVLWLLHSQTLETFVLVQGVSAMTSNVLATPVTIAAAVLVGRKEGLLAPRRDPVVVVLDPRLDPDPRRGVRLQRALGDAIAILPRVRPDSRCAIASATFSSGNTVSTDGVTWPDSIRSVIGTRSAPVSLDRNITIFCRRATDASAPQIGRPSPPASAPPVSPPTMTTATPRRERAAQPLVRCVAGDVDDRRRTGRCRRGRRSA